MEKVYFSSIIDEKKQLNHHGILGMKWGRRRKIIKAAAKIQKRIDKDIHIVDRKRDMERKSSYKHHLFENDRIAIANHMSMQDSHIANHNNMVDNFNMTNHINNINTMSMGMHMGGF